MNAAAPLPMATFPSTVSDAEATITPRAPPGATVRLPRTVTVPLIAQVPVLVISTLEYVPGGIVSMELGPRSTEPPQQVNAGAAWWTVAAPADVPAPLGASERVSDN